MQESVDAQLAALQPAVEVPGPLQFTLNFLWLEKNVAIAVDQLFDQVCCLHQVARCIYSDVQSKLLSDKALP